LDILNHRVQYITQAAARKGASPSASISAGSSTPVR
jgi:hypothetical protein